MKRILIVEDEFFLLESMIKFMDGIENARTTGVANLSEALKSIDNRPPDLIFSDINLPDGSGLDLIEHLASKDLHIPLIFVSAYISDYRNSIPSDGNIMVLEKPISIKRLRGIAREKLATQSDDGEYTFKLSDYLQIASLGDHTVRIKCGDTGSITLVNGEIWAAEDQQGHGEKAFKRLVAAAEVYGENLKVNLKKLDERDLGERNISGSMDNLLLNAVFEEEEMIRNGSSAEPTDLSDFHGLVDGGVEKLLNKEYSEALALFERAAQIDPNNSTVQTNIKRLNQMGFHLAKEAS